MNRKEIGCNKTKFEKQMKYALQSKMMEMKGQQIEKKGFGSNSNDTCEKQRAQRLQLERTLISIFSEIK